MKIQHVLGCDPATWEADLLGYRERALREARFRAGMAPLLGDLIPTGTATLSVVVAGAAFWASGSLLVAAGAVAALVVGLCVAFAWTQAEHVGRGGPMDRVWVEELMRLNMLCFENDAPTLEDFGFEDASVAEWTLSESPRLIARWRQHAEGHFQGL